jgi:regulator of replication initiation timing
MQIFNKTHLYFEQTAAAKDTIEDSFWLKKDEHKPYDKHDLKRLRKDGFHIPHHYRHPEDIHHNHKANQM